MAPSSLLEAVLSGFTIVKTLLIATALLWAIHLARRQSKTRTPGPMELPLVSDVFDFPGSREAENIAALGAKYGDIVYLEVFGRPIVMLNSQAALDLMDKRGSLYSDRLHMAMASGLNGRPYTSHALWGEVPIRTKANEPSSEHSCRAEARKARVPEWVDHAFDGFKANIATSDNARNSLCGSLMIRDDGSSVDLETESRVKSSGFGAGLDTMAACLSQFIMAMVLHPEIQVKVQKELDSVIGRGRLPTFTDRISLPYMECVFKESMRWGTPAPLSAPHRLIETDAYEGYVLPEGTICIGSVWGILHDERLYRNAHLFLPSRFENLSKEEEKRLDPTNYAYGFGRRRCPANHFVHFAVWFSMVGLLSTFNITRAVDKNGKEIEIKAEFEPGAIKHTKPFRYRFIPRHNKTLDLLGLN